ncbi:metallophosphoesterase [Marinospirillum insulare]|uniref:3',5'-cyclic adenosine monophosphate phosphodiesterase CpdA n=1 Tax=Marinospirillum insulare TaxID=217169 RepID=A0ABQ5ZXK9_9GAMM|nr:metallophosphoesterase [Marinospirillum insulare]GLR64226.1 3',5'-cyclic adenosine monophosphate phosphodiesterase CpdA [Marinospirillum insulare]
MLNQKQPNTFRLVQLTDLHLLAGPKEKYRGKNTRASFLKSLKLAGRLNPDLLLLTGDLAEDQQEATYTWLYQQLEASGLAWQWLAGNHDQPAVMAKFSPVNFHQQTQDWQLLGLNSHLAGATQGRLDKQQLRLIEQALNNPKPLLIALHHPPVEVGSQWKDALALQNAEDFWELLKDQPQAKLVVFGHVHQAFSCYKHHSLNLATPATSIQFTANTNKFSVNASAPAALRLIRLKPEGQFSSRLIHYE